MARRARQVKFRAGTPQRSNALPLFNARSASATMLVDDGRGGQPRADEADRFADDHRRDVEIAARAGLRVEFFERAEARRALRFRAPPIRA